MYPVFIFQVYDHETEPPKWSAAKKKTERQSFTSAVDGRIVADLSHLPILHQRQVIQRNQTFVETGEKTLNQYLNQRVRMNLILKKTEYSVILIAVSKVKNKHKLKRITRKGKPLDFLLKSTEKVKKIN